MNILSIKQERFCELVAEGRTYSEAYAVTYCVSRSVARRCGSRLMTSGDIQSRVHYLRRAVVEDSLLTLEDKRRRLAAIVNLDVMSLFSDGGELDLDAVHQLPSYILQDFTVTEKHNRDGSTTKEFRIKIADKLRALELDNKLAGHCNTGFAGVNEASRV